MCEWFALCDNPASGTVSHPVLGAVPTCERCATKLGLTFDECECSEDYGPCEDHCTVLAQREGSAARTGDELAALFINDAADIIREQVKSEGFSLVAVTSYGETQYREALESAAMYWEANPTGGWSEIEDMSQWLSDACRDMDGLLPIGVWTYWEDGYVIVKVHDDCPLNA